jgi:hypothetical protein
VNSYPVCVRACAEVSALAVDGRLFARKRIDVRDRRSNSRIAGPRESVVVTNELAMHSMSAGREVLARLIRHASPRELHRSCTTQVS